MNPHHTLAPEATALDADTSIFRLAVVVVIVIVATTGAATGLPILSPGRGRRDGRSSSAFDRRLWDGESP